MDEPLVLPNAPWLRLARRYVWWQSAEDAMARPHRVIAQVMNLGTLEDVMVLRGLANAETLRGVLRDATAGDFSERSWYFWHQMLGADTVVDVPPLPRRRVE